MKFGLFHTVQWPEGTEQRDRMREGLAQAVHAEELGFHSLWMTEHHFTRHGITADNLGLLAYLAASTERMRLGSAVSVLPFHNPLRLAEAAATVDLLSDGRFDFGVGRGYQWTEYHGFGVDIEQGAARFEESLELILRAWGAEAPFDHHGDFWDFDDVNVLPRPFQHPHPPVWVATASA
ncbi:MAG: LLM class flavin-dependent oxidoreductase, partial [Dehalococcoidia bacterium]